MVRKHIILSMIAPVAIAGILIMVPSITEKALAGVDATLKGVCGLVIPPRPCHFRLDTYTLSSGTWVSTPTVEGTVVKWKTTGNVGDEKGSVTYYVDNKKERAVLTFENPLIGSNKCTWGGPWMTEGGNTGTCTAGKGMNAEFTYKLIELHPALSRPPATSSALSRPENHTAS